MMDELSFYGTIGAVILIQVSFYWLCKHDHATRKLTAEYFETTRPLIVVVGQDGCHADQEDPAHLVAPDDNPGLSTKANRLMSHLCDELKLSDFKVLKIVLCPNGGDVQKRLGSSSGPDDMPVIRLNTRHLDQAHLNRTTWQLKQSLASGRHKLYAFICLQQLNTSDPNCPFDLMELLRNHELASQALLLASQPLIVRDRTRIVLARDERRNEIAKRELSWLLFSSINRSFMELIRLAEQFQEAPVPIQARVKASERLAKKGVAKLWSLMSVLEQIWLLDFAKPDCSRDQFEVRQVVSNLRQPAGDKNNLYLTNKPQENEEQDEDEDKLVALKIKELMLLENPKNIKIII